MEAGGFGIAALHSSEMSVVYKKSGFDTVPLMYTIVHFETIPDGTDRSFKVHDADLLDPNLIVELMAIHASFNSKFDG
jgi:hypothetical protein